MLAFVPGDTEEEVFDDMKGHGVTFQSITSLSSISHAYMYERHQDCTQVTHSVLSHFEVKAWKGGFVCLCGRVEGGKRSQSISGERRVSSGISTFPFAHP